MKQYLLIALFISLIFASVSPSVLADQHQDETKRKPDDDKVNPLEQADIKIIKQEDRTVEIYNVNGRVYQVKVIPRVGPPYYFYDLDGDGMMETRSARQLHDINVNQWKLYTW